MKHVPVIAMPIAVAGLLLAMGGGSPAEAASCYYRGYHDGHGVLGSIQGYGSALKYENACDRARRECNRRLERARKKAQLPRGGPRDFRCVRTTAAGGLG